MGPAANENALVLLAGDKLLRLLGDMERSLTDEAESMGPLPPWQPRAAAAGENRHNDDGLPLARLRSSWMKWQRAPYGQ